MKVKELIAALNGQDPNADVVVADPRYADARPLAGAVEARIVRHEYAPELGGEILAEDEQDPNSVNVVLVWGR